MAPPTTPSRPGPLKASTKHASNMLVAFLYQDDVWFAPLLELLSLRGVTP